MTEQSQTLYRKWRSQTFGALVGQDAVTQTLRQAVGQGRLAHAYLFSGPRGTGKTSTARLLAKMINCATPQNGEPCNSCDSCREITEGRSTDVFEIDAASNRGIDEIRDLRDRVRVAANTERTRVYIIDEIHMLTEPAFNALLKTLEEPPPRVIFVLATTDPQKVPETVISRCQRFEFRRIGLRDLVAHLAYIADQEHITAERSAFELIARAARGGMRDALSLLDQVRAFAGDVITAESTRQVLGQADPTLVRDLVTYVADGDTAAGLHRIHDLAQSGVDLRQLTQQIGELWRQLMLARAGADIATILDLLPEDTRDLQRMAASFSLETLANCARIFAKNDAGPHTQIVPQLSLELAFLDCVAAARPRAPALADSTATVSAPPTHQADPSVAPRQRQADPPPKPPAAPPSTPEPPTVVRAATPDALSRAETPGLRSASEPAPRIAEAPGTPTTTYLAAASRPARGEMPGDHQLPLDEQATPAPLNPSPPLIGQDLAALTVQLRSQWKVFREIAKQRSIRVFGMLGNAHCSTITPGTPPVVVLGAEYEFHCKELSSPEHHETIEWALQQTLNIACHFTIVQEAEAPPVASSTAIPPPAGPPMPDSREIQQMPHQSDLRVSPTSEPPTQRAPATSNFATPAPAVDPAISTADPLRHAASDPVVQAIIGTFGGHVHAVIRPTGP